MADQFHHLLHVRVFMCRQNEQKHKANNSIFVLQLKYVLVEWWILFGIYCTYCVALTCTVLYLHWTSRPPVHSMHWQENMECMQWEGPLARLDKEVRGVDHSQTGDWDFM